MTDFTDKLDAACNEAWERGLANNHIHPFTFNRLLTYAGLA